MLEHTPAVLPASCRQSQSHLPAADQPSLRSRVGPDGCRQCSLLPSLCHLHGNHPPACCVDRDLRSRTCRCSQTAFSHEYHSDLPYEEYRRGCNFLKEQATRKELFCIFEADFESSLPLSILKQFLPPKVIARLLVGIV